MLNNNKTTITITYDHQNQIYIIQNDDTKKLGIEIELESIGDIIDFIEASIQLDRLKSKNTKDT